MIDIVSDTMGQSWEQTYRMSAIELFNIFAYCQEKTRRHNEQMKEWTRKH